MRPAILFLFIASASAQTSFRFDPAVVTHCTTSGIGRGTLTWNYDGQGAVQIHIGAADGAILAAKLPVQGSIATGDIVTDGTVFVLTDAGSQELARTTAIVQCNPAAEVLTPALAAAPYYPLQVGDEWIYSENSRLFTNNHYTRKIVSAQLIGDSAWYVFSDGSMYRNDDMGRIYRMTTQGEQLWLDPTVPPDPSAILKITARGGSIQVPAGTFQDRLDYSNFSSIFDSEVGTFARGIGLVQSAQYDDTGSNGGLLLGMTLVYARIDGHIVYASPAVSLELAAEASSFDVTNQVAPNCAIPCYFAACYIVPFTDPAGTYKPCFQARVRMGQTANDVQSCDIDLLDGSNNSVFHTTITGTPDRESAGAVQVPLYTVGSTYPQVVNVLPLGNYQLRAQTPDGRVSLAPIQLK